MLLFEFVGELFQFEQREPELDPLFQLPPRITVLLPDLPLPVFDPSAQDRTNLGQQHLRRLNLARAEAADLHKKSHPKAQAGQTRVGHIDPADLVGLSRLVKKLWNQKELPEEPLPSHPMFPRDGLGNRVELLNQPLVLLHNQHLIVAWPGLSLRLHYIACLSTR